MNVCKCLSTFLSRSIENWKSVLMLVIKPWAKFFSKGRSVLLPAVRPGAGKVEYVYLSFRQEKLEVLI